MKGVTGRVHRGTEKLLPGVWETRVPEPLGVQSVVGRQSVGGVGWFYFSRTRPDFINNCPLCLCNLKWVRKLLCELTTKGHIFYPYSPLVKGISLILRILKLWWSRHEMKIER